MTGNRQNFEALQARSAEDPNLSSTVAPLSYTTGERLTGEALVYGLSHPEEAVLFRVFDENQKPYAKHVPRLYFVKATWAGDEEQVFEVISSPGEIKGRSEFVVKRLKDGEFSLLSFQVNIETVEALT